MRSRYLWRCLSAGLALSMLASAALAIEAPARAGAAARLGTQENVVPRGTRAVLRLKGWLSSEEAEPGDRFEATLVEEITVDGRVAVPAGAIFGGRVVEVEKARRLSRGGKLTLIIDKLVSGEGPESPAAGRITGLAGGEDLKGDGASGDGAAKGGIAGALLGGLLGGTKGALIGIAIGTGGSLAAGRGKPLELPEGTYLRVKFDQEVKVTWTWKSQS